MDRYVIGCDSAYIFYIIYLGNLYGIGTIGWMTGKMKGNDDLIESINRQKLSGFHYKTWLISGVGFFTDAYDLFIIGVVLKMLPLAGWNPLDTADKALIASTALLSAVIGASVFGALLDRFGRKSVYGINLVILIGGALGSAFLTPVNGVFSLILWRFILGVGIGGDYAISSTIMSEYSNTKNRGRLVGMVFSMQSLGLLAGPLFALGAIYSGISLAISWRILLAIGAVPALMVVYWRTKLPETPKYTIFVKGDTEKAARDWKRVSGEDIKNMNGVRSHKLRWTTIFTNRKFLTTLVGTAGTWFLMDWALYGNSIMSHTMLRVLVPEGVSPLSSLTLTTIYSAMIFGIAAFPGYWLATFTLDRIGRKPIQLTGFMAMTITYLVLGIFTFLMNPEYVVEFLVIYGMSFFFIEFGPNVTTFIYPPEVFPTSLRGLGTGISAAGGKTGAFIGTALNIVLISIIGESGLFLVLAGLSAIGFMMTLFMLPETKGVDIEKITGEDGGSGSEDLSSGIKKPQAIIGK